MSIDEKAEADLYSELNNALVKARGSLRTWPKKREQVFKDLVRDVMLLMGWTEVKLSYDKAVEVKHEQ